MVYKDLYDIFSWFKLMIRGLHMIWRLAKDHDLPKIWPYGRLKSPKIENETSKNRKWNLQKYRTFIISSMDEKYRMTWTSLKKHYSEFEQL